MPVTFVTYLVYLVVSIGLTIWVARTLSRGGRVFLVDVFRGNEELADSVNHMLVIGFYLINLGYVSLSLKLAQRVGDATEAIEALSMKVGFVLLVLGGMHLFNLFVLSRIRRNRMLLSRSRQNRALRQDLPPVAPDLLQDPREMPGAVDPT